MKNLGAMKPRLLFQQISNAHRLISRPVLYPVSYRAPGPEVIKFSFHAQLRISSNFSTESNMKYEKRPVSSIQRREIYQKQ